MNLWKTVILRMAQKNLNCSQIIDRLNELIKKSFSSDDKSRRLVLRSSAFGV